MSDTTNIAFASFSDDQERNIQYLTKVDNPSDELIFQHAVTVSHGYRNVGSRQFLQMLIHGAVDSRDLDVPDNIDDADDVYLSAFETLDLQKIDELIADIPSLEDYIDTLRLKDEGYLQEQILEYGHSISNELMRNDRLGTASNLVTYTLEIQGHSAQTKPGDWVSPSDIQYHAEVKVNPKNEIVSYYGHEFDAAAQQIYADHLQDDLLKQIKTILEKNVTFKFIVNKSIKNH